ncbi:hypothetical protein BDN70DRAFT_885353 [Pholiota conissans]|uniref:F-box domain-containing protein n=1 Tax=Pholiota conissans TaxID=109636 RepID=A0A9P6CNX0_9AGAR|nr:hypothetical protein BDN70DRAFT_885353 [Pholiota conissans]
MVVELLNLPRELQIEVLAHLDAVSLTRCAMTCKSIYNIFRESSLLQYIIQLHFDGVITTDVSRNSSYSELIDGLLRRRRAWLSLGWDRYNTPSHVMQQQCKAYEFIGGVFGNTDGSGLEIVWLPGMTMGAEKKIVKRPSTGVSIRDFTMDPAQDVIALLEADLGPPTLAEPRTYHIHIRTISTNSVHPRAGAASLSFVLELAHSPVNYIIRAHLEFARDIFVAVLHLHFDGIGRKIRVLIWDWTTSELRVDSAVAFDPFLTTPNFEFSLLNRDFCMTTSLEGSGSIRLYKFVGPSALNVPVAHVATLHLPPTASHTKIARIATYAGPIEAHSPQYASLAVNDDDRLHVFMPMYNDYSEANLFVPQRVLMKYARRDQGEDLTPLDVPWEEWGPRRTRMFYPAPFDSEGWSNYVHGQRVVCPGHSSNEDQEMDARIEVLDFSLAAVSSATPEGAHMSQESASGHLLPPTVISKDAIRFFLDDVVTSLPCVMLKRKIARAHETYMIYSNGIVGLNFRNSHLHLEIFPVQRSSEILHNS